MLKAGTCTTCRGPIWRSVPHPISGEPMLLWPDPTSVYATYGMAPDGLVPGIGYCKDCAPAVGDAPPDFLVAEVPSISTVRYVDTAGARYRDWYTDTRGVFMEAWLREQHIDPGPVLAQWQADRVGMMEAMTT